MKKLSFTTCCLLLVVLANSALGQRILGEFTGTITDPNGEKVVEAKVTAVDPATGRTWTGQTNEDGVYRSFTDEVIWLALVHS